MSLSAAKSSRKDAIRWTGYKILLSETCDEYLPYLITNVHTTAATTQDVACTADIQETLTENGFCRRAIWLMPDKLMPIY